ncbi:MAG: replisome organizer [Sulfurovaceae bacterium]
MAERRMFSKKIIYSDVFLDLPVGSKNLYFYLLAEADDEGFVNSPKRTQRLIGATDDDIRLLLAKNFIILFESGIVVVTHWRIHNYIQKDRFKPTTHIEEKALLSVKENNEYILDTECIQLGRLGKDRIGKVSVDKDIYSEFSFLNCDIGIFSEEEFKELKSYRSQIKKSIKTQETIDRLSKSFQKMYAIGFDFKKTLQIMKERQWQLIEPDWVLKKAKTSKQPEVGSYDYYLQNKQSEVIDVEV